MRAPRFRVGDPLPALVMAGAAGGKLDLSHQSRAGRPMVLAAPGDVAALPAPPAGSDIGCYALLTDPSEVPEGWTIAVDGNGAVRTALFGDAKKGVCVLDAAFRLAGVFEVPAQAVGFAAGLAAQLAAEERRVQRQAPVAVIERVLEPDLIGDLLRYWDGGEKAKDAVASTAGGNAAAVSTAKRRSDVILNDRTLIERVTGAMGARVIPEIYKTFRSRIVGMEALRIGCYDAAERGEFTRHRDNTTPHTAHRRFAMSLNLTDPSEFEGGAVRFPEYSGALYAPPAGAALIFSCALLHEALPVLSGRRFAMFTFLNDAEGAAAEQKMLAAHKSAAKPARPRQP